MTATSQRPELAAALLMLERMGLSLDDLAGVAAVYDAPTFTEFVPKVRAAVTAGTLKPYGSYWDRMIDAWPDRRLTEPTPIELSQLAEAPR